VNVDTAGKARNLKKNFQKKYLFKDCNCDDDPEPCTENGVKEK